MHEFDIGLWKAVFSHLLLILYDAGHDALQKMNARYRQCPPFGRDLRQITNNPSGMKQLAAHHFVDLLQASYSMISSSVENLNVVNV